jgi:hypothetical protein
MLVEDRTWTAVSHAGDALADCAGVQRRSRLLHCRGARHAGGRHLAPSGADAVSGEGGGTDQAYEFESLDFPAVQRLLNSYFAEFFAVAPEKLRRHPVPSSSTCSPGRCTFTSATNSTRSRRAIRFTSIRRCPRVIAGPPKRAARSSSRRGEGSVADAPSSETRFLQGDVSHAAVSADDNDLPARPWIGTAGRSCVTRGGPVRGKLSQCRADGVSVRILRAYSACADTFRPPCNTKSARHRQTV